MPIEVELKARVEHPKKVRSQLRTKANGVASTYRDTYYDWPDHRLSAAGRQELRLRIIETNNDSRGVWTYKGAMLDEASTPELETEVANPDVADAILTALGLEPVIAYTKQCENFVFDADGWRVVATLVRLPELDDTFIEIETLVASDTERTAARQTIRTVLGDLGLGDADLEPAFYIDMVTQQRSSNPRPR